MIILDAITTLAITTLALAAGTVAAGLGEHAFSLPARAGMS
jgi:hypothetical protein